MAKSEEGSGPRFPEWIFFVVGIFFFFTVIGSISALIPSIGNDIQLFFQNFALAAVPNTGMTLPAPTNPGVHLSIYTAAAMFCLAWGAFAIVMLVVRLIARSPPWKTAEEFSSMVWWFGAWYLLTTVLTASATVTIWFVFWSEIVMLIGGSLIIRALILAAIR